MPDPIKRRRLSPAAKLRIRARQNDCCSACKKPFGAGDRIEFDHGWDLWLGGPDTEDNLFAKHDYCHLRKTKRQTTARAKIDRITGETCNGPKRKIPQRVNHRWPERKMRNARHG